MGRGLAHGHTEVRGRPRTGAQAFSLSSHPTFPPSTESRNLRHNICSPQQLLRFGEQWTKELNAHRDSAIVLVQPLPSYPAKTRLPILTAAPGAPGACHLLMLVTTHAACPSLWATVKPRVDPESWGCQALLSQTGISGRGEERDKALADSIYWVPGVAPRPPHALSQFILSTPPVWVSRMTQTGSWGPRVRYARPEFSGNPQCKVSFCQELSY